MRRPLDVVPHFPRYKWPKVLRPLTDEGQKIHDDFVKIWLQTLPTKSYGVIETFNHTYPLKYLPAERGWRTIEIGAGIGSHLAFEDLAAQEYHCVELRENVASELRAKYPDVMVTVADCQTRLPYDDHYFDRAVVVHVLEHLPDLPAAISELRRVLKVGGLFSLLIPCDPGLAYEIARKISAERVFRKTFDMPYRWIARREHLNSPSEIMSVLRDGFQEVDREYYPLRYIPIANANLVIGLTYRRV